MLGVLLMGLLGGVVESPGGTATGQMTATGQVTASEGTLYLDRDGRRYQAGVRSAIRPGDRLETQAASGSGASLFLFDGDAVFLGPGTVVAIGGTTGGGLIRLDRGEVRATVSGRGGMSIVTPQGRATIGRGILRASATPEGTRFWPERGSAEVVAGDAGPSSVVEGQESFLGDDGGSTPSPVDAAEAPDAPVRRTGHAARALTTTATGTGWAVTPDALRLAGAAADSRRLKDDQVTELNDGTAIAFQSSGQMGPGISTPATPGAAGGRAAPPEGDRSTQPTPDDAANQPTPADETADQPIAFAQVNTAASTSASSIAFSGASGAFSAAFSSGAGSDAQQDSRNPSFPGNIHLITTVNQYNLSQVHLGKKDTLFPTSKSYYSIGVGPLPTHQVTTSFLTGTGPNPNPIPIPHFNAYLVQLSQYNITDPAIAQPTSTEMTGISGLLGANPVSPQVANATPLTDSRARFNDRATFALGEFALDRTKQGHHTIPQLELRRSDQDRQIIPLTATTDRVTPNPDVAFNRQPDFRFFPEFGARGVFVPTQGTFQFAPSIGKLDLLRKAAVTTLLASTLLEYSHQTGQTQFAIGGKVFDITGYHLPKGFPKPADATGTGAAASPSPSPALAASKPAVTASLAKIGPTGGGHALKGAPKLRSFGAHIEATRSGNAAAGRHANNGPGHRR